MRVKFYLLLTLLLFSCATFAQENTSKLLVNGLIFREDINLPVATKKSMIDQASIVYRAYKLHLEAAPLHKFSFDNTRDFIKRYFTENAKIELMNPITKKRRFVNPEKYFAQLDILYSGKYDSTSKIRVIPTKFAPRVMIDNRDSSEKYYVFFEVLQEMDNRKNGINEGGVDMTGKTIQLKLSFDDNTIIPKIEFIYANYSYLK